MAACLTSACCNPSPIQSARLQRLVVSLGGREMGERQFAACLAGLAREGDAGARRLATQRFLAAIHPDKHITLGVFQRLLDGLGPQASLLPESPAMDVVREGLKALAANDRLEALRACILRVADSKSSARAGEARMLVALAGELQCAEAFAWAVASHSVEHVDGRPLRLLKDAFDTVYPDALGEKFQEALDTIDLATHLIGTPVDVEAPAGSSV